MLKKKKGVYVEKLEDRGLECKNLMSSPNEVLPPKGTKKKKNPLFIALSPLLVFKHRETRELLSLCSRMIMEPGIENASQ